MCLSVPIDLEHTLRLEANLVCAAEQNQEVEFECCETTDLLRRLRVDVDIDTVTTS